MKIALAGASGFVGQSLIQVLAKEHEIIALSRSKNQPTSQSQGSIEWRACDLFSLLQIEEALQGAELAIYLVHSMLPTARLNQANFEDTDLLLADNFARAARKCGVKRILYLGGLIPGETGLSRHLASRLEVEHALASTHLELTVLRAGLILGPQGSSFQILYLLVKRLPVMLCPKWVRTLTQAISLRDAVQLIAFCVKDDRTRSKTFDIGSPDVVSYRALMQKVAGLLGKKRVFFDVPFFTPGLSKLWVSLITGASRNLVSPLVESLRHPMIVQNNDILGLYGHPIQNLDEALKDCVQTIHPSLRASTRKRARFTKRSQDVRSVQRLHLPRGKNAQWLAAEYFGWLERSHSPWLKVTETLPGTWTFRIPGLPSPLLTLVYSAERSTPDRQIFYITDGKVARLQPGRRGRLEFREVLGGASALAAIHDFVPSLPWQIYKYTQARVHLWVMRRFDDYLTQGSAAKMPSSGR